MSEGEAVGLIRQVFICRQYFHLEKTCHHHCLLWLIITAQVKFRRWKFLSSNISHPNNWEHRKAFCVNDANNDIDNEYEYTRRTRMGMERLISRSSASSGWPSGERARSDHIVTGIYLGWFCTFHSSWFCILADFVSRILADVVICIGADFVFRIWPDFVFCI